MENLSRRAHIQDHDHAGSLEYHWGYPDRVRPCTNDAGSCEYLDVVYWMHDTSMLYTFIMWAVIGGVLAIWIIYRLLAPIPTYTSSRQRSDEQSSPPPRNSLYYRSVSAITAFLRRWLLPERMVAFFGHITGFQILVLSVLLGYLLIFSLVGIVYQTWVTPVKKSDKFNTRTGLGGFADRVGALAYALTPLTVALSTRESILSLITGLPYQSFNFLHRWTGRVIFIQSFLHTLGWTIVEGKLYQPQPKVYQEFMAQQYIIFGVVAMLLITLLYIGSMKSVMKWTGHEVFRKTHYVIAALYFGACWGHWAKLACWMIASIGIMFLDRGVRLIRLAIIHYGGWTGVQGSIFKPAQAALTLFPDIGTNDIVVRIDFQHQHRPWKAGQHFFVCFPELSIWQSHPFTTASLPQSGPTQEHTYIVRCRNGQTANLAKLAATTSSTPVILTGPYGGLRGEALMRAPPSRRNLLAIAGGTGISFALPLVLRALSKDSSHSISLVWIIRRGSHLSWFKAEISRLQALAEAANTTFCIQIFVTREAQPHTSSTSSLEEPKHKSEPGQLDGLGSEKELGKETFVQAVTGLDLSHGGRTSKLPITYLASHHPSMDNVLTTFLEKLEGTDNARTPTVVAGSGPSGLGHDIRATVARINDPEKVWRGDGAVVECVWDDRGW